MWLRNMPGTVTRRSFLRGVVALVAGGILPVSAVRAAWEKLPPGEPEKPDLRPLVGEAGPTDQVVQVKSYEECKRLFGDFGGDDFERELLEAMTEEIAKEIDRVWVEELLKVATEGEKKGSACFPGWQGRYRDQG